MTAGVRVGVEGGMQATRKRLHATLLTGAFVTGVVLIGAYGWMYRDIQQRGEQLHLTGVDLTRNIGRILLLDEVLTMSARMAAASGDLSYEARYRRYDPELDRLIKATLALAAATGAEHHVQQTDEANLQLVEMEYGAFSLIHAGRAAQALSVLTSPAYLYDKERYSEGMHALFAALQEAQQGTHARLERFERLSALIGVVGIAVVFIGWIASIRTVVARWQAEVAHAELEQRVRERTEQLSRANADLRTEVTERQKAEGSLKQANEELTGREHALLNVLADLKRSHSQLQTAQFQIIQVEKLAAIGQLASGIAHELKNPLGIVLQGVSFLRHLVGHGRAQEAEVLGMMEEGVIRADKIIRGLLTLAKPAALKRSPYGLNEVVESSLALVEKQLGLKSVEVVKEFAEGLPPALLDWQQMEQALINLQVNALQVMRDGGRLTLRTYTKALTTQDSGVGQRATDPFQPGLAVLICEVADTGAGIAPEHMKKLFEPFFTTKPPGEGTGLGLAIVRSIVEAHQGRITVESQIGRGTTFRLVLPITA